MEDQADKILEFFHQLEKLKTTKRTGWLKKGIKNCESIADHQYRMSILIFLLCVPPIDSSRCLKMALVHDMAEAITGDLTPDCGISAFDKYNLEKSAFLHMLSPLKESVNLFNLNSNFNEDVLNLWEEYNSNQTPEAQLVKDLDKFEFILQLYEYEERIILTQGKSGNKDGLNFMDDYWDSAEKKIKNSFLQTLLRRIKEKRNLLKLTDIKNQNY